MRYLCIPVLVLQCVFIASCQKELPDNAATPAIIVPDIDTAGNGNNNDDTTTHADGPAYFVRFTVNGIEKEYSAYTKASFPEYVRSGAKLYACQVEAQQLPGGTINALHLTINDTVHIVAGRGYEDHLLYNAYQAIINYNDSGNNFFSSVNAIPNSKTQVYILTIAPDYVSGTFSGKLGNVTQDSNGLFPDSAIISNGYFKVARY